MSCLSVFLVFLRLGLTAFGGPAAHLAYFRHEFVVRRRWLDDPAYTDLVALCQFLPGPASSQAGFALGLMRAGWPGAAAAWLGFTLPSAALLLAAAAGVSLVQPDWLPALVHGLKLAAVAVVAHAVWGMAAVLCTRTRHAVLALLALACTVVPGGLAGQLAAIGLGAAAGALLPLPALGGAAGPAGIAAAAPTGAGIAAAGSPGQARVLRGRAFGALLVVLALLPLAFLPLVEAAGPGWAMAAAYYRAGALVFGGGHVVLPMLQEAVVAPGWVGQDAFLAGYGLAQAVPGPLFTLAAWLGAVQGHAPNGLAGGMLALAAIFLPGLLLVAGALPWWQSLRSRPRAAAVLAGVGAAVVGILAGAWYDPVWRSAVAGPADFAVAVAAFALLARWRAAPWLVVLCCGLATVAMAWLPTIVQVVENY